MADEPQHHTDFATDWDIQGGWATGHRVFTPYCKTCGWQGYPTTDSAIASEQADDHVVAITR